jgi:hypothetical protein
MTTAYSFNPFVAIARLIRAVGEQGRPAYADRIAAYALDESYYHNQAYGPLTEGGYRQNINAALGNAAAADLSGLYNPVAEVVELYQHVLGGSFLPSDARATEDQPTDIRAVPGRAAPPELLPALDRIWQWSNIDVGKQQLCRLPALHGTCGLRIVAQNDAAPDRRRVYLKPEHPRCIRDVETDARGNVTDIELQYDMTIGIGDDQQVITVRERMTKEAIRTYRLVGGQPTPYDLTTLTDGGPRSAYVNALGVVPYVLVQHHTTGEAFGLNAFYRARDAIDRVNALLTHINTNIFDHVKVDWFMYAEGEPPARIPLQGRNVVYVKARPGGVAPVMAPMVAPLALADSIAKVKLDIELIEDRLPELKAVVGKFLSGQSGETIAQLRRPAEDRLALARASYEDALVRAQQIALSWGVLLGLWDLGTGTGTREAADRAYRSGREDHQLNRRPLLPPVAGAPPAPRPAIPPAPVVEPATGATTEEGQG